MAPQSQYWALAVAELAVYAPLAPILLYILFRHGRRGALGWFFLQSYCVLQLVGSGMVASTGQRGHPPAVAGIVTNVGVSALLLGSMGVLLEACKNTSLCSSFVANVLFDIAFHVHVATAAALSAVGATKVYSGHPDSSSEALYKAGIFLLLAAAVVYAAISLYAWTKNKELQGRLRLLLMACLFAVPMIGVQVIDRVLTAYVQSPAFKPVNGSTAVRVCLSVAPGMLAVLAFVGGGLATVNDASK